MWDYINYRAGNDISDTGLGKCGASQCADEIHCMGGDGRRLCGLPGRWRGEHCTREDRRCCRAKGCSPNIVGRTMMMTISGGVGLGYDNGLGWGLRC